MHYLFGLQDLFCKGHTSKKVLAQLLFLQSQPVHWDPFLFMCGSACNVVHLVLVIKAWRVDSFAVTGGGAHPYSHKGGVHNGWLRSAAATAC